MAKKVTVTLLDPIEHHDETIGKIALKEPTGGAYATLGEPRLWIYKDGGGYWVEQPSIIRAYIDKAIDHQDGPELLRLMSLADTMQVKDAVLGFFQAAEQRVRDMRTLAASKSAISPSA